MSMKLPWLEGSQYKTMYWRLTFTRRLWWDICNLYRMLKADAQGVVMFQIIPVLENLLISLHNSPGVGWLAGADICLSGRVMVGGPLTQAFCREKIQPGTLGVRLGLNGEVKRSHCGADRFGCQIIYFGFIVNLKCKVVTSDWIWP